MNRDKIGTMYINIPFSIVYCVVYVPILSLLIFMQSLYYSSKFLFTCHTMNCLAGYGKHWHELNTDIYEYYQINQTGLVTDCFCWH